MRTFAHLALCAALALALGWASAAIAQERGAAETQPKPAPNAPAQDDDPRQRMLDGWSRTASALEAALRGDQVNTEALDRLRLTIARQRSDARALADSLAIEIAPLRAQFDALSQSDALGAPGAVHLADRQAEVAERLRRLEALRVASDLAATRAAALEAQLAALDRTRFAERLMTRGPSLLSVETWRLASDRALKALAETGPRIGWDRIAAAAAALIAALSALTWISARLLGELSTRLRSASLAADGRARRAMIRAGWLGVVIAPWAIAVWLSYVGLQIADLAEFGLAAETLSVRLAQAATGVFVAYVAARAIFAPQTPEMRVVDLGDARARRALRLTMAFALAVGVMHASFDALRVLDAPNVIALLALGAGAIGGVALIALGRCVFAGVAAAAADASEADEDAAGDDDPPLDIARLARGLGSLATLAIGAGAVLAAAASYPDLVVFLLTGAALSAGLVALLTIVHSGLSALFSAPPRTDEAARPRSLPILIGVVLALLGAPAFALIWGASPVDLSSLALRLLDGVDIGGARFSPVDALIALVVLLVGVAATRTLQGVLRTGVLPNTRLDGSARTSIVAGVGYAGFILTALFAVGAAGLDLTNLALVVGALSVGIGFGLQNIVNNFVSGLILLIERPVKIGDWIVVGDAQGYVRRINVRSTEIETFDRSSVIVPNSDLISTRVTNFTHKNTHGRITARVRVDLQSDPDEVLKILREAATAVPGSLRYPPPVITFSELGTDALIFHARVYLRDINYFLDATSTLNSEIFRRLKAAGVKIPRPQSDLYVQSLPTGDGPPS